MPFSDLARHRRIVDLLSRSISRDTLPPSLIFAGPTGAGKRATALALAQALNCLSQSAVSSQQSSGDLPIDACGTCAACLRIARGVHPDVLVVEPGDNGSIKIDQVRDIIDRSAYRPFEGRRRVVIVDEADALVPPAQNALLKTLEEPPASSVFILVTSRPDMLLPTVRSRCIRLWFAGGAAQELEPDARQVAERVLVHVASGPEPAARRIERAKDLLTNTGSGGASDREQLSSHLRAMASLLRDVEIVATQADARLVANSDAGSMLERLAPTFRGDRGVNAFHAIDRALAALDGNAGVKVVADWLVLQL
jgi:DNA polymerase III delta' subunit